jgi:hypothetical protein
MERVPATKGGRVPVHWIRMPSPDGTPENIAEFRNNPHGFEQWVWWIVTSRGGSFSAVYFNARSKTDAYVLFDSNDATDVDGIVEELQGTRTDLETVPEHHRNLGLAPPPPPEGNGGRKEAS